MFFGIEPETALLFMGATAMLVMTPGPVVGLLISETLTFGPKHALVALIGVEIIGILQLSLYVLGFAWVAEKLPLWMFDGMLYLGVGYLAYLGITRFRQEPQTIDTMTLNDKSLKRALVRGMIINSFNPKFILFYAVFFPQFLNPTAPMMVQLTGLSILFILTAVAMDMVWIFGANQGRRVLQNKGGLALVNKVSGSILILGAVLILALNV